MTPTSSTLVAAMLAAILALATGASTASAQDEVKDSPKGAGSDEFVTRLFAGTIRQKNSYACFSREYDAAHLASHKLQKVAAMRLLVTAERVPEDEALNYSFRLGVRFRHRSGNFDSSGDCGHAAVTQETSDRAVLKCSVDCDGGGLEIGITSDNKSTMIRLERVRIWRRNNPDEEAADALMAGADDRMFRLHRVSLKDCTSLVTDRKELAALRHK
jgi:hypothetical protein